MNAKTPVMLCYFLIGSLLLTACMVRSADTGPQKAPYFRPPTLSVHVTPITTPVDQVSAGAEATASAGTPGPDQPTPTVLCKDNLVFDKDLTIPDGTEVEPESTLDKRWEVENKGNCNWDERYRIRLIAGPDLGAQKEQALFPARSGALATLRIQFKAPKDPGTYRSAWQAFDPQGQPFGDPFFIEIKVK